MSRLGAKITAIDASNKNIEVAKLHAKKNNLNINYLNIEPENLKLKKNWSKHHLVDQSIRNSIANYIGDASDDDWILISDIDEVPNPNKFIDFNKNKKFGFFEQQLFSGFASFVRSTRPYLNPFGSNRIIFNTMRGD